MKLFSFFSLLVLIITFCVKNGETIFQKNGIYSNRLLTIPHTTKIVSIRKYDGRKPNLYIDLKKKKNEKENEDTKQNMVKRKECPLRRACSKNILRVTGITVPVILGGYYIYNSMMTEKKNYNEAEKNLGPFLYKLDSSENINSQKSDIRTKRDIETDSPFNLHNRFSSMFDNFRILVNFFKNVKKVKTKDVIKDYTILFFHSYNVDMFLKSKNIKTYVERLKEIYKDINKNNNVNIVYVPLDNKLLYNVKHLNDMNWYTVSFNDKKNILKLIKKYNIMNIPTMVLLNKDMNVIQDNINYLLLYKSADFPYSDVNSLTYIDYVQDRYNNKTFLKKLKSDYFFFYFDNDKDNKEDIKTLLKIKKKLAEKNILLDIVYVRDVRKNKTNESQSRQSVEKQTNQTDLKTDIKTSIKEKDTLEGTTQNEQLEDGTLDSYSGGAAEKGDAYMSEHDSEKKEKKKSLLEEEQMENVYNLGEMDNNVIYKLLLYDTFDVTFKPVGVLVNKKGSVMNKYVNISKREEEINSFIYENYKSSYEPVNINNYSFKFENISNLANLNVFAPIFILFSNKLDLDLLKQYNDLIGEYKKNRKGKKIYFYYLPQESSKFDALKKLCSLNKPNEMVILDLFNQQIFKDDVNNLAVVQEVGEKEPKYSLSKENFFNFINKYYGNDLYSSRIQLAKQT